MKEGYICLVFQPINVMMNDINEFNKFCMFYSNINKKGMQDYLNISKWHTFIGGVKILLKTLNNGFLFGHPCFLYFFSMKICN
jgi:hypothetical protein